MRRRDFITLIGGAVPSSSLVLACFATLIASAVGVGIWEATDSYRFDVRFLVSPKLIGTRPEPYPAFYATLPRNSNLQVRVYKDRSLNAVALTSVTLNNDECGLQSPDGHVANHPTPVALVGESISWGAEVAYEDALPALLRTRFGIGIANFAVSGTNSSEFPDMVRTASACTGRVGFSAAIIGLFADLTIGDLPRRLAIERSGPRVMLDGVQMSSQRYGALQASLIDRLRFKARVWAMAHSSLFNRLFPPAPSTDFAIPIANTIQAQDYEKYAGQLLSSLDQTAAELKLPPAKVVIWIESSAHELTEQHAAGMQQRPVADWVARSRDFWSFAIRKIKERGYVVADPRDTIDRSFLDGGEYPFAASGHYRPIAYHLTAPLVAEKLEQALVE